MFCVVGGGSVSYVFHICFELVLHVLCAFGDAFTAAAAAVAAAVAAAAAVGAAGAGAVGAAVLLLLLLLSMFP